MDYEHNLDGEWGYESDASSERSEVPSEEVYSEEEAEHEEEADEEVTKQNDASGEELHHEAENIEGEATTPKGKPKSKKRRGMTRLAKLHEAFQVDSDSELPPKHEIVFDEKHNIVSKYRSEFSSFLGDLARKKVGLRKLEWKLVNDEEKISMWEEIKKYYIIEDERKAFVLKRIREHLKSFRKILYNQYIRPYPNRKNLDKEVPKKYKKVVDTNSWASFVKNRLSPGFKEKSEAGKEAVSYSKFPHRTGRGGYAYLREQLVEKKLIPKQVYPERHEMWSYARGDKSKDYALEEKSEVKVLADKMKEKHQLILSGVEEVGPKEDALTKVLGIDKPGKLRGFGYGYTQKEYWGVEESSKAKKTSNGTNELKKQLVTKDKEVADMTAKVKAAADVLLSQGLEVPEALAEILRNYAAKDNQETLTSPAEEESLQKSDTEATYLLETAVRPQEKSTEEAPLGSSTKCILRSGNGTMVARGIAFASKVIDHTFRRGNKEMKIPCYKVVVKEAVDKEFKLPIHESEVNNLFEAVDTFILWPRSQMDLASEVPGAASLGTNTEMVSQSTGSKDHLQKKTTQSAGSKESSQSSGSQPGCKGRKCTIWGTSRSDILARGRAFKLKDPQPLHGKHGVLVKCHKVWIDKVLKGEYCLPVRTGTEEKLKQVVGKAIFWPADEITLQKVAEEITPAEPVPAEQPKKQAALEKTAAVHHNDKNSGQVLMGDESVSGKETLAEKQLPPKDATMGETQLHDFQFDSQFENETHDDSQVETQVTWQETQGPTPKVLKRNRRIYGTVDGKPKHTRSKVLKLQANADTADSLADQHESPSRRKKK